eukprot:365408-Chlamydomonas_euryale.AAC.21
MKTYTVFNHMCWSSEECVGLLKNGLMQSIPPSRKSRLGHQWCMAVAKCASCTRRGYVHGMALACDNTTMTVSAAPTYYCCHRTIAAAPTSRRIQEQRRQYRSSAAGTSI